MALRLHPGGRQAGPGLPDGQSLNTKMKSDPKWGEQGQGIGIGSFEGSPYPGHRRSSVRIPASSGSESLGPEVGTVPLSYSPTRPFHVGAGIGETPVCGKRGGDWQPLAVISADLIPRDYPAHDIECVVSAAL